MNVRVWVDGSEDAGVPALDRGLQYGDGLFETMAVVAGRVRLLGRHLARLEAGCAALALPGSATAGLATELQSIAAGLGDGVLKLIVTRGCSERGYAPPPTARARRIVMATSGRPAVPPARLAICVTRLATGGSLAGLKHLNRLEQVIAMREVQDADDSNEGLMRDTAGRVVEAVSANLFVVRSGRIATPCLDRCGVAGVMRALVLETAAEAGLDCAITDLSLAEVAAADELFLTSTLAGIRSVAALDGRAVGEGPVTRNLRRRVAVRLEEETG